MASTTSPIRTWRTRSSGSSTRRARLPMGPFKPAGVILDESASGCWTVHHSILDYKGQWYLFYHDKDLSPSFDKNRAIRADKLFFNADGTIRKVIPTLRGVGLVEAKSEIQIDRYSATSAAGVAVSFLDEANPHAGWKTTFSAAKSWVRFNEVDFGAGRAENDRSAREGRWRRRARDPSGRAGRAGDRPRRSGPGNRLENGEWRREEHSRRRPRPLRDPGRSRSRRGGLGQFPLSIAVPITEPSGKPTGLSQAGHFRRGSARRNR